MAATATSTHSIWNERLMAALPWLVLGYLALFAWRFADERLYADSGYYLARVVNEDAFRIEHGRWVLAFAQALPLIGAVRAADLTAQELHDILVSAYAKQLRMPELTVTPRTYASRQVFVGGEVARPGIYEMPANIDAFQAIALAGGFLPSAHRSDVLILSRATGETTVSEVDLSMRAVRSGLPGAQALQRYDVVYVPRSRVSQVNLFMQQYVRDALPVQFSFYYDLRGGTRNN